MPAVRFMRKSRAIESQHDSDLSRVGRNDAAKGRDEGQGVIRWNGLKRKQEGEATERQRLIDSEKPIASQLRNIRERVDSPRYVEES